MKKSEYIWYCSFTSYLASRPERCACANNWYGPNVGWPWLLQRMLSGVDGRCLIYIMVQR